MINEPKTPPVKETTGQPTATPSFPNKPTRSKLPIILAVIIVLFLIGYIGYLIGKCLYAPQAVILPPSPFPLITKPTPTPDLTDNWKTYKNTLIGIILKYPDDLVSVEELEGDRGSETVRFKSKNEKWDDIPSKPGTLIDGYLCDITYWNNLAQENYLFQETKFIKSVSKRDLLINNIPATRIKYQEYSSYINYHYQFPDKKTTVRCTLPVDKTLFYENEIDKIILTIKFIDQNQTDETANWKTYTNSKFSFSFKYPEKSKGAANPQIDEQPTSVLLFVPNTSGLLFKIEIISNETIETQYNKDKSFIKEDLSSLEKITFNGYKGYKTTFSAISPQAEIIYMIKGDYLFKIYSLDAKIPQQILSTFKFLD